MLPTLSQLGDRNEMADLMYCTTAPSDLLDAKPLSDAAFADRQELAHCSMQA
ncbi:hypothetical protein [Sphingomonas sp. CV7422]|uniref:hypothetical protein n=1 Tax=Sphingomonas sp. CV7422 TaxID=3018036 RepID=UPI0022FDFB9F|nr:hypothetical protein [Sphingomonas sp. CV7422]